MSFWILWGADAIAAVCRGAHGLTITDLRERGARLRRSLEWELERYRDAVASVADGT